MESENNKIYQTALTICGGLIIGSLIFENKPMVISAAVLAVICIFSSYVTEKIHWLWMKLAHILGLVNSKILLTLIFFLILLPLSLLSKLSGKGAMILKKKEGSYYSDRDYLYNSSDLDNTW